jgi:flagellin-like protein
MKKMNTTRKRSLKKDEKAVSPVIGVIMMIAIVVIIAAVVAAFAYGIIGGVKKAPSSAMVVEGVKVSANDVNVTIFHHGGDAITEAFSTGPADVVSVWDNIEVRVNGAKVNNTLADEVWYNNIAADGVADSWGTGSFTPGDQLKIQFNGLTEGDSIVILHVPSENILQRITVSG